MPEMMLQDGTVIAVVGVAEAPIRQVGGKQITLPDAYAGIVVRNGDTFRHVRYDESPGNALLLALRDALDPEVTSR